MIETDYNKSNVMIEAWQLVKIWRYTLSEAMKISWGREKLRSLKAYQKLSAPEKAIINKGKKYKITVWMPTPDEQAGLMEFYHGADSAKYQGD